MEAESHVINHSWNKNGDYLGVADSVGLMVYEGTQALNYVKNYNRGSDQWEGFPIKVNAPSNTILLGCKGSSTQGTIETLARAAMDKDLLGIMVWYSSVKNGFQYAVSWDAQLSDSSKKGYESAMQIFAPDNTEQRVRKGASYTATAYNAVAAASTAGKKEADTVNDKHHSIGYVLGRGPWPEDMF